MDEPKDWKVVYATNQSRELQLSTELEIREKAINSEVNENELRLHQYDGKDHNQVVLTTTELLAMVRELEGISIGKITGDTIRFTAEKDKLFLSAKEMKVQIEQLCANPESILELALSEENGDYSIAQFLTVVKLCALVTQCEMRERGYGQDQGLASSAS